MLLDAFYFKIISLRKRYLLMQKMGGEEKLDLIATIAFAINIEYIEK